mgnify:CR=1 FL=1
MAKKYTKLSPKGETQASVVMREFYAGKLRDRGGNPITDPERAKAVAMSEGRTAESRGTEERTFKGRKRTRPQLK